MELIIFILVVFGASNILVNEYAMQWFREFINNYFKYSLLNKLITCISCSSFWIGCLFYWILIPLTPYILLNILIAGCIGSATSKIISKKLFTF